MSRFDRVARVGMPSALPIAEEDVHTAPAPSPVDLPEQDIKRNSILRRLYPAFLRSLVRAIVSIAGRRAQRPVVPGRAPNHESEGSHERMASQLQEDTDSNRVASLPRSGRSGQAGNPVTRVPRRGAERRAI